MSDTSSMKRVERLRAALADSGVGFLLVDDAIDLRYITGFTGSNGLALISAREQGPLSFLTDFRYTAQAEREVWDGFERLTIAGDLYEALPSLLGEAPGRLGFDEAKLTVRGHRRLGEILGEGWELVSCRGLFEGLRAVKEPEEIAKIAAACALADEALEATLEEGFVGRTERQVALALETTMRKLGAQELSFPSIVASAEHGALPHAQPRDVEIKADVLVTIDWGAQLDGYCSDCTRTYIAGGTAPAEFVDYYDVLLAAQIASCESVRPGVTAQSVDAAARNIIIEAGYGDLFIHRTGHGIGLEEHEDPYIVDGNDTVLQPGMCFSIEPGIYSSGHHGARIEDIVVVTDDGVERLDTIDRSLVVLGS
jgi:Xaa-Pro aminopeptidase